MKNQIDLQVYPRNKKNESRILHTIKKAVKLQILRNSEMHAGYIEVLKTSCGLMHYLLIFANFFLKKENYLMGSYARDLTFFYIILGHKTIQKILIVTIL